MEQPLLLIGRPRTSSWQGERAAVLSVPVPVVLPVVRFELAMVSNVVSSKVARRKSADVAATVVTERLGRVCRCIGPGTRVAARCVVGGPPGRLLVEFSPDRKFVSTRGWMCCVPEWAYKGISL